MLKNSILHRKDALILITIEIIDKYGIQGLTTREIAKQAGISEGTIYKHFKTKNDLILAVLDYFSMYDIDIKQTIRLKQMQPKEAIIFFMRSYVNYYQNYSAITALTETYSELINNPDLANKVQAIYMDRSDFIKVLVEEAQLKGEIKPELDSENISDVIMGLFRAICLKWRFKERSFCLNERTLSTLTMTLDSFSPQMGSND